MSVLRYTAGPVFVDGAEIDITAGVRSMTETVRTLDLLTLGPRDVMQAHANRFEPIGANPLRYWEGSFIYRTGLTQAAVIVETILAGTGTTPRLRWYAKRLADANYSVVSETLLTGGLQGIVWSGWSPLSLQDGDIVEVYLEIFDTNPALPGGTIGWPDQIYVIDAWVEPSNSITSIPAWTAPATFTTGPSSSGLASFATALDHLVARVNAVPRPVFQTIRQLPGLFWSPTTFKIWSGGAGAGRGAYNRLIMDVAYEIVANQQERLVVRINGADVATLGPFNAYTAGTHRYTIDLSGYASDAPLRIEWVSTISADVLPGVHARPSRYTVGVCRLARSTISGQTLTLPTFTPDESVSWSTQRTRLNQLGTAMSALYTRLNTLIDVWGRARMFRRNYGYDAGQQAYLGTRYRPLQQFKIGGALIIGGTGVQIGYGITNAELVDPKKPDGERQNRWSTEETLLSGDQVAAKVVSLDALPGLNDTQSYDLIGTDTRAAFERYIA